MTRTFSLLLGMLLTGCVSTGVRPPDHVSMNDGWALPGKTTGAQIER